MRVVCVLQTQVLWQGQVGAQRARALEWALRVALPLAACRPMEVARRGEVMEVTLVAQAEVVPAIVATSGKVLGVAFRPFVLTGVHLPPALEAGLIHLHLPTDAIHSGPEHLTRLAAISNLKRACGALGGSCLSMLASP